MVYKLKEEKKMKKVKRVMEVESIGDVIKVCEWLDKGGDIVVFKSCKFGLKYIDSEEWLDRDEFREEFFRIIKESLKDNKEVLVKLY